MPRGVLFVHNNFPGQFRDLAGALMARGIAVAAIGQDHAPGMPDVPMVRYRLSRGTTQGILPDAVRAEADLIRARGARQAAAALKIRGWDPEVIVAHPGWGEATHLGQVFPEARQVAFAEFYYRSHGFDVGFDTEFFPHTEDDAQRIAAKNAVGALAYAQADAIVSPTAFQAASLPPAFRPRCRVIHEGVDVEAIRPAPPEPFALDDGRVIAPGTPVITYANNNMEPLRGLHIFARALPRLLAEVPDAHVLIAGRPDGRPYGGAAPDGGTWTEACFRGLEFDRGRAHFLGKIPHARLLAAMRLGAAHVYYTYPFVLSWSLVEAMALGCNVIASDTAPLHDAITDGVDGRLLPFFDVEALSEAMIAACRDPGAAVPIREAARRTAVGRFSREAGRAGWFALLRELGLEV